MPSVRLNESGIAVPAASILPIIQIDSNRTILAGYDDDSFSFLITGIKNNLPRKSPIELQPEFNGKAPPPPARLGSSGIFVFATGCSSTSFDKTRPFCATVLV